MDKPFNIEAITQLFQDHYGLMIVVALRYAPSPELAYDIVQQVFIDFIEDALKRERDYGKSIAPFLRTLTKNRAIDCWREYKKNSPEHLQRIAERFADRPVDDETLRWSEEISGLRSCMKKLPPPARQMVEQHYFHGTTMEDIAVRTGRKAVTVRSFFSRIRQKLRECIERETKQSDKH